MSKRAKPVHRVIGINRIDGDLSTYASQIEAAMNKLHKDGYNINTREQTTGILIHGELQGEHPMLGLMGMLRGTEPVPEPEEAGLSPRTHELLDRFSKEIKPGDPKFTGIAANVTVTTTGFSVEELNAAASEIEKALEVHGKDTPCRCACYTARFYEAVLTAVKSTARLNLQ